MFSATLQIAGVCFFRTRGCLQSNCPCLQHLAGLVWGRPDLPRWQPLALIASPHWPAPPPLVSPARHLLISVYPAPLLGGGRPVLLVAERSKDGDRAGTCRPQSFPTRACELRAQHNPPDIQRYQTIPDDRQLNVSAGTEERLICRRQNNARPQ